MEQKRQKVENLSLKRIWLVCQKEEEKVVLFTSLHVHVLIKNKERMIHEIISQIIGFSVLKLIIILFLIGSSPD